MLKKSSIEDFLSRKLNDFSVLKECPLEDYHSFLEREVVPNGFAFKTEPRFHQLVGFYAGLTNDNFIFRYAMGSGKTKMACDIASFKLCIGKAKKVLVLTHKLVNVAGWVDEVEKHSVMNALGLLASTSAEKLEQLKTEADIYIVDYTSLQVMFSTLVAAPTDTNKNKREYKINEKLLKVFAKNFDILIYDEIHQCKNRTALRFKMCKILSAEIPYRYGLTGTLFGRDPFVAWAQFFLIDKGESLGDNYYVFREALGKEVFSPFAFGNKEIVFDKDKKPQLQAMISNRCINYDLKECRDLPERSDITQELEFSVEQKKYYQNAIQGIIEHKDNIIYLGNAWVQLRQISSGYFSWRDENGEQHSVQFKENPKLDFIFNLLENTPEEEKLIVFCEYTQTGKIITEALKEAKIGHRWLYGQSKDKVKEVQDFIKNPAVKVLVANSASGGTGLNLQVAHYVIFFESPVDPIIRSQAEARAWARGDSADKVFFYDLLMKKSVERKVLQNVQEGKELHSAILSAIV